MASEILRVDNQETLEALQREADELKKKLEDEKAKLKDVESNYATCAEFSLQGLPFPGEGLSIWRFTSKLFRFRFRFIDISRRYQYPGRFVPRYKIQDTKNFI